MSAFISKSKYLAGLQCHKRLWIEYNASDLIPPVGRSTQVLFDQGHQIGALAKRLFPDGLEVEGRYTDFEGLVEKTHALLDYRKPLFEPAFSFGNAFARIDILVPFGDDSWDLIEVKSAGKLKDPNLDDIAFQTYVCTFAGLRIRKCFVMHVDKSYVRHGAIDAARLLTFVDVTAAAEERSADIRKRLIEMEMIIGQPTSPQRPIGVHCVTPVSCPIYDHCWSFLPEHSVFTFSRFPDRKGFDLLDKGILSITDLPADYILTDNREIQVRAVKTGEVQLDESRIREFLSGLRYPLHFLDFETINTAVPMFEGTSPFQQVPFQYSLHILRSPGSVVAHHGFLSDGVSDPRIEIIKRLRSLLGTEGSVLAYKAQFEKMVIRNCCKDFPASLEWYEAVLPRFIDLLAPFESFAWYHPSQCGSASMKVVLPLLTGLSYDGMEIADGNTAGAEFLRVTLDDVSEKERMRVRALLEEYCGMDTFGMVKIVERLSAIVNYTPVL